MSNTLHLSDSDQTPEEAGKPVLTGYSRPTLTKETFAWALFDFATLGGYTVILTTIFNCYFINEIAGGAGGFSSSNATLLWTLTVAASNLLVVFTAPTLGAIADYSGGTKRFLIASSLCFFLSTLLLGLVQPGQIVMAVSLVIVCNFMVWTGLNLAGSYLLEIATRQTMGRISGIGGALGYAGILVMLGGSLAYVGFAEHHGLVARQFVPMVVFMTAVLYLLSVIPSFLWLRERTPKKPVRHINCITFGLSRLRRSVADARKFKDLYNYLLAVVVYASGTSTVRLLAAVYAQQVMAFKQDQVILMMLILSVAAGIGAFWFGHLQDRIGSIRTLQIELLLFVGGALIASLTHLMAIFWMVAVAIGLAAGGTRITGRALVGQFSPAARSAEFFGLLGLGINLSYIIGPVTYGLITYFAAGNQRLAILSPIFFFVVGIVLLGRVNESRGEQLAQTVESKGGTSDVGATR